jgi:hypothetical protein
MPILNILQAQKLMYPKPSFTMKLNDMNGKYDCRISHSNFAAFGFQWAILLGFRLESGAQKITGYDLIYNLIGSENLRLIQIFESFQGTESDLAKPH